MGAVLLDGGWGAVAKAMPAFRSDKVQIVDVPVEQIPKNLPKSWKKEGYGLIVGKDVVEVGDGDGDERRGAPVGHAHGRIDWSKVDGDRMERADGLEPENR